MASNSGRVRVRCDIFLNVWQSLLWSPEMLHRLHRFANIFLFFFFFISFFFFPFSPGCHCSVMRGYPLKRTVDLWTLTPRSAPLTLTRPCLTSCMKGVKVVKQLKIKQPFSFVNQPGKGRHQISVIRGFEPTKPTCQILKVTLFISHDVVCSHHKCLGFYFVQNKVAKHLNFCRNLNEPENSEFRAHLRPAALIYGDILSSSEAN